MKKFLHPAPRTLDRCRLSAWVRMALLSLPWLGGPAWAVDAPNHAAAPPAAAASHSPVASAPTAAAAPAASAAAPAKILSIKEDIKGQLKQAIDHDKTAPSGKPPVARVINSHGKPAAGHGDKEEIIARSPKKAHAKPSSQSAHDEQYQRARAIALTGHAPESKSDNAGHKPAGKNQAMPAAAHAGAHDAPHWSYEGETGPSAWGRLQPEFIQCLLGKRQSPVNITNTDTLQGPAEPLQFDYAPSNASVVNNGHTLQVDLGSDNTLLVRGARYKLLQFHFHTPSEEQINGKPAAMVAHLVHKNDAGQLAVVAVLLEPGAANSLIHDVWTYTPLDAGDRVRVPDGLIDVSDLLPNDQRYYQFMGSLTTPPCTEGVLWMVLRQPVTLSAEQLRLFRKLFPNNARPVQPVNGRVIREAM